MKKAVVVLSGGMDSAVALYKARASGYEELYAVSFNYGQRHKVELDYARKIARSANVKEHKVVKLTSITSLISASSLTSKKIDVPEGHYASENMKLTVVPNRNMIMYSIAIGYAVSIKADAVYVGVHAGDHFIYPDCRPQFIHTLDLLAKTANEGFISKDFQIVAPFLYNTKAEIASLGSLLKVPFENTWSCYKGGLKHCGKCGTCVERKEAFALVGLVDPTEYEE
ncbi:MAG TPA: 7-cyano-7-deazaguanine synthase QueC [Ignavibacteriaceae bacterium]|nr:7-cyano-7-deazaguanine synthase QueC [Ignavibacteriaceae bacterium]